MPGVCSSPLPIRRGCHTSDPMSISTIFFTHEGGSVPRWALSSDDPDLLGSLALLELDRNGGTAIEIRVVGLAPEQAVLI